MEYLVTSYKPPNNHVKKNLGNDFNVFIINNILSVFYTTTFPLKTSQKLCVDVQLSFEFIHFLKL